MNLRAVIFDIYGTILTLGAPPPNADVKWDQLWQSSLSTTPRLNLAGLETLTRAVVEREHAAARTAGNSYPEILWPNIVREAIPELNNLPGEKFEDFILELAGIRHTACLIPGAGDALRKLSDKGPELGLASNAQAYTLRELDRCLSPVGLSRRIFNPHLCFLSFQHGFAKPDPRVVQLLDRELSALGIAPPETMMVGNRLDNDIQPARAQGWRTWQLTDALAAKSDGGGDWDQLLRHIERAQ